MELLLCGLLVVCLLSLLVVCDMVMLYENIGCVDWIGLLFDVF